MTELLLSNINLLLLESPLGQVRFNCSFLGKSLCIIKPQSTILINSKAILSSWSFKECHIEFLYLDFPPKLPSNMHVDKCVGGVWRIKTMSNEIAFKLDSHLESSLKGSPESGEYLLAQSFEDSSIRLTIGTEDNEALIARSIVKDWLPSFYKDVLKPSNVCYEKQGLRIVLPESDSGDLIQVHFIVAWTSKGNDPLSTWYAVDQSPEYILNFLNLE